MARPLLSNNDHHIVDIRDSSDSSLCFMQWLHGLAVFSNTIDFIITFVKVTTAIVVLKDTKGEHSEATWIITDTCACILSFPILCWNLSRIHDPNSEISTSRNNEEDGIFCLKTMVECFFPDCTRRIDMEYVISSLKKMLDSFSAAWSFIFFWVFLCGSSSLDHSSDLYSLCVAFIAIGCIRYVVPMVICTVLGCCVSNHILRQ